MQTLPPYHRYVEAEYDLAEADAAFQHAKRRGALKVQIVMPSTLTRTQSNHHRGNVRVAGTAGMRPQQMPASREATVVACSGLCTCSAEGGRGASEIFQLRL